MLEQENPAVDAVETSGITELPEPAVTDTPVVPSEGEPETKVKFIDLEFPFGRPEDINWELIDSVGHEFLKEVNLRPWMKSTEFRAGYVTDLIDIHQELHALDLKFVRGVIPDVQFRRAKATLRDEGIARFFLNVNVYNMVPFLQWIRMFSTTMLSILGSGMNPVVVRLNPLRPGLNYTMYWDYWNKEEQVMIHEVAIKTLQQVPV